MPGPIPPIQLGLGASAAGGGGGGVPSGPAGGDLGGTYPNPDVVKVASTTPSAAGLSMLSAADATAQKVLLDLVGTNTGDQTATTTPFTPTGSISATDTQAAVAEVASEAATATGTVATDLANHIADTSDAHDASAISFVPAGTIAATDTQAAIEELDNDSRMSNARTPTAHAASHLSGGGDTLALTNAEIAAAAGIVLSKLATQADLTIVGNNTGGAAAPIALTASQVRTLLALVIGTNVQAWDADLDTWAGKTAPSGTVVGTTDTQTLSNKRRVPRVVTLTDAATVTPDADTTDVGKLTSLSQATQIANPTGTPDMSQLLVLRVKSTTTRAMTWGSQFRSGVDVILPTATTGSSKTDYWLFMWNSDDSKWDVLATAAGY